MVNKLSSKEFRIAIGAKPLGPVIKEWLEPSTPESEEELKVEELKVEQPIDVNMTQELTKNQLKVDMTNLKRRCVVDESDFEPDDEVLQVG